MNKVICPRCMGNGYIKVKEEVGSLKDVVVSCTMCNSEGEVKNIYLAYDSVDPDKLQ